LKFGLVSVDGPEFRLAVTHEGLRRVLRYPGDDWLRLDEIGPHARPSRAEVEAFAKMWNRCVGAMRQVQPASWKDYSGPLKLAFPADEPEAATRPAAPADARAAEEQAVRALLRFGKVERDANLPGRPVVAVDLRYIDPNAVDMAKLAKELGKLKSLRSVQLWASRVTDADVAHLRDLRGLQYLGLRACYEITDAALAHLKDMKELQYLQLYMTKVTDAGLKELKGLRELRWIDLLWTKATPMGLRELKDLPHLRTVLMSGEGLTDKGLLVLKELPRIQVIACYAGPQGSNDPNGLEHLELWQTKVTDLGLLALKDRKSLRQVVIRQCPWITDSGVKALRKARPDLKIEFEEASFFAGPYWVREEARALAASQPATGAAPRTVLIRAALDDYITPSRSGSRLYGEVRFRI
ncbi:MAG: hypothetical protein KAU28_08355, partial [Phycisphaerae bacterium]|nr:hypothetical protein [Phycisphaerae bacterium]